MPCWRQAKGGLGSLPFRTVVPSSNEQKAKSINAEGKKRSSQYCLPVSTRLAPKVQRRCQYRHRGSYNPSEGNPDVLVPIQLGLEDILLRWHRNDGNTLDPTSYRVSNLVQVDSGDDGSRKQQHVTDADFHRGPRSLAGSSTLWQVEGHWQAGNH